MIRTKDGQLKQDILDGWIEVRPLEPLSFDEAKALVVMLGGSHAMPPVSPGVGLMPQRHQRTPLQELFASLPPRQRQAFMECMDRVWPRKARQAGRLGRFTIHDGMHIYGWDDAWAAALSAASKTGETVMGEALRRARDEQG